MDKFKDFADKKKKEEEAEKRRQSGHLGWKISDVEFHDDDKKPINEYHGGLTHPYSDIEKKKAGKAAADAAKKPYHSDHPDQLNLKFKGEKNLGTHDRPHKITSASVIEEHSHSDTEDHFEHHNININSKHIKAIHDYKRDSSEINETLRNSKGKRTPDYKKELDHVTSHTTTKPMTVYRGIHDSEFHSKKVGTTFTDHGYTGTSIKPHVARGFAHDAKYDEEHYDKTKTQGSIFRIHMPAGTKAHYLDMHNGPCASEHEVLLHRGTKFKIKGHSEDEHGKRVIDLHVVGQRGTKK